VDQVELEPGLLAVTFSDGVFNAGRRRDRALDSPAWESVIAAYSREAGSPALLAEKILQHALALDDNMANDDMTVMILGILDVEADGIRRLQVEYPVG
jgi:serine phosphatase RsbU (regulator of sigma subunit)